MDTLAGRRIVVTRRAGQASTLVELLCGRGAVVIEVPAIEVVPPDDVAPLDRALGQLSSYQWIVLTSANAVNALLGRIAALGLEPRLGAGGARLACVGPATSAALRASFPADRVELEPPADFRAAGLAEALSGRGLRGARVLLPVSSRARQELPAALAALGADVDVVEAYRTIEPPDLSSRVAACLAQGFDLVAFASPSAVEAFASAAGDRAAGLAAVAIGPTTALAARAAGFDVRATARPSTAEGLVAAAEMALERVPPFTP
jgi:uroporphyrinogen-III synthase